MAAKKPLRIKNYTSEATVASSIDTIRKVLTAHKAKRISTDYDDDGREAGITFVLVLGGMPHSFKVPVNIPVVEQRILESYPDRSRLTEALKEQAERTAWAIVRDWVASQMAIIDAGMVRVEQVFLPYLLVEPDRTAFDIWEEQRALPAPHSVNITEVP